MLIYSDQLHSQSLNTMLSPSELSSLHDHFHQPHDADSDRKSVTTEISSPMTPSGEIPPPLSIRKPTPPVPPRHPDRVSLAPSLDAPTAPEPHRARKTTSEKTRPGRSFQGTFVSLCLVNFVCAIDSSILSVALPVSDREQLPAEPAYDSLRRY